MEKIYVESCNGGILFESELPIKDFLKKNGRIIEFPSLKIYEENFPDCNYSLKYINNSNRIFKVNDELTQIYIEYPISELNQYSIIYPGYLLIEKNHYDNNSLTCHSACVEKNGEASLFLGKVGSGKTSVAINLCCNYGYKLVANDKTVLQFQNNKLHALGGTKFLFLRYESIARNLPNLLSLFSNRPTDFNYSYNEKKVDSWQYKVRVLPEEIGINESTCIPEIKNIYFLHVDENQEKLVVNDGNSLANRLYLNELLSRTIRCMETTFRDKNNIESSYIPSFDCEKYYNFRKELISYMIDTINLEYISGNIHDVSKYVNQKQLLK